jgi:hypothetical protein
VEKTDGKTAVNRVTPAGKPAVIYELLGGSPGDLLLPRNSLIVEGRSDQIFIRSIVDRFYPDRPPLQVVFSEGDFERQRQSMSAINTVFAPLAQSPIYRDRLVILCDKPHPTKQADFDSFINSYRWLVDQKQIFILPVPSLEEYYSEPYRQIAAQVEELGRELGLKREMARHVGKNITREQLESGMPIIREALETCWTNAFA